GSTACADGVVDVTEAAEAGRLAVQVAGGAEQQDRVLVAPDGLRVAVKVQVDVAKAVPGVCLGAEIAQLADEGERLLAVGERLVIVAQLGEIPADVVEGTGLPFPAARGLILPQALARVLQCLPVPALRPGQPGQVHMSLGLAGVVAKFSVQIQGDQVVGACVVELLESPVGEPQPTASGGLADLVTLTPGSGQGRALGGLQLLPVSPPIQERSQGRGEPPGIGVEAGRGSGDRGQQY